ncbi:MAG: TIGR01212 family radical SAM protein, partial [Lachnospiraceae bacterium]|nr:TIGR01212 family radical SAM protein [Lachnospiraceae bacterium]
MIPLSDYLQATFGEKIYRLSLSSGCTCPNRDGRIGYGGCTFCSEGGSGEFAAPALPVEEQIRLAKER